MGVALNLAVWFGLHVFVPGGADDPFAAAGAGAAFVAMQGFGVDLVPVGLGAVGLSLLHHWLGGGQ